MEINQPSNNVSGDLTKEGILNLLEEDDNKPPEVKKEPEKKEKEDEDEEPEKKEEIELSEEEPLKEEEIDETNFVAHSSKKEILKKYPELFKEYPSLERAYYKDQQYSELLPTIDDAREAVEKAANFDKFQQSILGGSIEAVLKSTKETDQDAFAKIVDDLLPSLAKADVSAFHHIVGQINNITIRRMVEEAQATNNEQLQAAALLVHQFVFGTSKPVNSGTFSKSEKSPEKDKLEGERRAFAQEKFETNRDNLSSRIDNTLRSTVDNYIDPKGVMTPYIKKNAISEVISSLDESIASDAQFRKSLDKLWERAMDSNYSRVSMEALKNAYLSKSKTILPQLISKVRNEALKGLAKQPSGEQREPRRGPLPVGASASSSKGGKGDKNEVPKGMKTLDFLMQD